MRQDCFRVPDPNRRRVLATLLALGLGLGGILPAQAAPMPLPSLADFVQLSRLLTGAAECSPLMAQPIFELLTAEPWGREHLAQLSQKWLPLAASGNPPSLDLTRLSPGERWFAAHWLTTWLTGIYYHQSGNRMVSYRDALMYLGLATVRPVPGFCGGEFGAWSEPPAGV